MDYRSPLDNIFNIISALPQGHDKPVKHALYNAVAIFILILCCGAACALYMILEPFIKPLVWALLVGSVLHPIKYRLAQQIRNWFDELDTFGTPVIFGMCMSPFRMVNNLSEFIGSQLLARIRIILSVIIMVPAVHATYYYTPRIIVAIVWRIWAFFSGFIVFLIGNATLPVVCFILIAYASTMFLLWKPTNNAKFHVASICIWIIISGFLANNMGSLRIPVFIILQLLLLGGFISEIYRIKEDIILAGNSNIYSFNYFQILCYCISSNKNN